MKLHVLLSAALGLGAISACSGSDTTASGPNLLAELLGTWDASFVVWTQSPAGTPKFDLIAQGGSLTLTVTADGRYATQMAMPTEPTETSSGTLTVAPGLITTVDDSTQETEEFTYTLTGGQLDMATTDESFDFNGDGIDEPAQLSLTFRRRK